MRIRHSGTPQQFEFWTSSAKFRAFVGGIGSGKTRAGCVEVLRQPPGAPGMVVAPTYPMLRDATLETFRSVFDPVIKKFSEANMEAELHNGTKVMFRSAHDPDRLRGPNLGWFWLDEAAMMPEIVWDIMIGRLRLLPGRAWITTTPRGYNWVWRLFVKSKDPNYHLIRASTRANSFLPPDFVKSLEAKYTGAWLEQELEGEFVEWTERAAYDGFKRAVNCERGIRDLYRPDLPLRLCCDFNVGIMVWPVVQVIGGKPYVLQEIAIDGGANIRDMVRKFRNEFPAHRGDVYIYGDASGNNRSSQTAQSDYDLLRTEFQGYPSDIVLMVPSKNPPPRDRIQSLNRLLMGSDDMPPIKIDEDYCPYLILDLIQVEWNNAGTDVLKVLDPQDDRSKLTHASDALGYFAWREFPVVSELVKKVLRLRKKLRRPRLRYGKLLGDMRG